MLNSMVVPKIRGERIVLNSGPYQSLMVPVNSGKTPRFLAIRTPLPGLLANHRPKYSLRGCCCWCCCGGAVGSVSLASSGSYIPTIAIYFLVSN